MGAPRPLRIQIASDLHLEMMDSLESAEELIIPSAPYLALLGDVGCPGASSTHMQRYKDFLVQQAEKFEKVFVIPGNHEFYSAGSELHRLAMKNSPVVEIPYQRTVPGIKAQIATICDLYPEKLVYLDGAFYEVEIDGIKYRIVGSTLWSRIDDENMFRISRSIQDYSSIFVPVESQDKIPDVFDIDKRVKCRKLSISDTNGWHETSVKFIENQALIARNKEQRMIVLTHHSPVFEKTSHPRFHGFPESQAFSTNLDYLFQTEEFSSIKLWCQGHTHYNQNAIKLGSNCLLVSNQRGYAGSFEDTGKPYSNKFHVIV